MGTVGSTSNAGTASITNSGTSLAATFDFVLRDGPQGTAGTNGTDGADGAAATVAVGTTGSVPNTGTASVTNGGSSSAATLDFVLRDGPPGTNGTNGTNGINGTAATIAVGTVGSTSNAGTAAITNSGTSGAATFDFVLRDGPQGAAGINGTNGSAATVSVGTTGSVPNTGTASVVNSGSSSAATLDFVLRDGPPGTNGTDGIMSSITQGAGITVTNPAGTSPTVAVNSSVVRNDASGNLTCASTGTGVTRIASDSTSTSAIFLDANNGGVQVDVGDQADFIGLRVPTAAGGAPQYQMLVTQTGPYLHQNGGRYLNLNSTTASGGFGLRGTSNTLNVKNNTSDDWGQPYHANMANGSGSFFEGSTSFNARGSTFTFTHGLSVAAQGCPRIIQAYIKRVAAGTVRGIPQYDWVTIDTGTDYENFNSGLTIRGNAFSIHVDIGVMNRGITIIAPDNFQEYIVPIDGSFDIVVRAWL